MRSAALGFGFTCSLVLGIGCGEPSFDNNTPEGMALHAVSLAASNSWDQYHRLADNPNRATLEETGGRPQPGSYAEVLMREGEALLRSNFDEARRHPNLGSEGLVGTARAEGSQLWAVTVARSDGTPLGMVVHVALVEGQMRVRGFEIVAR